MAKQGKTSPQAELESTLKQFFDDSKKGDLSAVCRFPARLTWLRKALDIDDHILPKPQCSKLKNWLNNLQADGLTLIFPVSILNSPASMFGHTFLRFDRKNEQQPDLLAWTVSYAAHAESEKGIRFALKGLFGGYPGKFSLTRYDTRVKEYSDIESRDVWEYQLNFSRREIYQLLLHLWEILLVYFDYYFIDENCAYQLLTLLEAARPEPQLTEQFYWDAAPADTVKALNEIPKLIKKIKYRPANRQIILTRAKQLPQDQRQLARSLALGDIKPAIPGSPA